MFCYITSMWLDLQIFRENVGILKSASYNVCKHLIFSLNEGVCIHQFSSCCCCVVHKVNEMLFCFTGIGLSVFIIPCCDSEVPYYIP